jgi:hypothetical protein
LASERFDFRDFSKLGNRWVKYEGEFQNGCKQGREKCIVYMFYAGQGVLYLTNGERFKGQFANDQVSGKGVFYSLGG